LPPETLTSIGLAANFESKRRPTHHFLNAGGEKHRQGRVKTSVWWASPSRGHLGRQEVHPGIILAAKTPKAAFLFLKTTQFTVFMWFRHESGLVNYIVFAAADPRKPRFGCKFRGQASAKPSMSECKWRKT